MEKLLTVISTRTLKEILGNAIVYSDYIAVNHDCQIVRKGAKEFSESCEKTLQELK